MGRFSTAVKSYAYYQAECSCTWKGPRQKTYGKAAQDRIDHTNEHVAEINRHKDKVKACG